MLLVAACLLALLSLLGNEVGRLLFFLSPLLFWHAKAAQAMNNSGPAAINRSGRHDYSLTSPRRDEEKHE